MPKAKSQSNRKSLNSFSDGRDEMNLVEFPFATLSERAGSRNVLEFQVSEYDRILGRPVERKLTVTGDVKYGLPTAKDEEVYLGLLQLTKMHNDFREARVLFTRGELIRLMGWKNRDWSYHRVATALLRLTGVRLFYENAWRDNSKKKFRTKGGFGLLDSFELRDGRIRAAKGEEEERLSEFRWNSVILESCQAGYLKKIDYEKIRSFGAKARRMYRYLDKHFHAPHRTTLKLDLRLFACEHIGLSRDCDAAQIRRGLKKAIEELEQSRFIAKNGRRFTPVKGQRGRWEVIFTLDGYSTRRSIADKPRRASNVLRAGSKLEPDRIDVYLESLSNEELVAMENQALIHSDENSLASDRDLLSGGGPLAAELNRQLLRAFVKNSKIGRKNRHEDF